MSCVNCKSKYFSAKLIDIKTGSESVKSLAWVCDECKQHQLSSKQVMDFIKLSKQKGATTSLR